MQGTEGGRGSERQEGPGWVNGGWGCTHTTDGGGHRVAYEGGGGKEGREL